MGKMGARGCEAPSGTLVRKKCQLSLSMALHIF
jgi:hypothetical protein